LARVVVIFREWRRFVGMLPYGVAA
jgi:hypothetical protein